MTEAGIQTTVEVWTTSTRSWWKIMTDSSLNHARGYEVVSPALRGGAGIDVMQRVLKIIDQAGCTVTKKCGFHCHVGAAHLPFSFWRNLIKFYSHYEPAIDLITAPSRRRSSNDYCRSTASQLQIAARKVAFDNATTLPMLAHAYQGMPGRTDVGHGYQDCCIGFISSTWRRFGGIRPSSFASIKARSTPTRRPIGSSFACAWSPVRSLALSHKARQRCKT